MSKGIGSFWKNTSLFQKSNLRKTASVFAILALLVSFGVYAPLPTRAAGTPSGAMSAIYNSDTGQLSVSGAYHWDNCNPNNPDGTPSHDKVVGFALFINGGNPTIGDDRALDGTGPVSMHFANNEQPCELDDDNWSDDSHNAQTNPILAQVPTQVCAAVYDVRLGNINQPNSGNNSVGAGPDSQGQRRNNDNSFEQNTNSFGPEHCVLEEIIVTPPTKGHLTVIKHVINDNGGTAVAGDFSLSVLDEEGTDVDGSPAAGSEAGTVYTLAPGDYTVSEDGLLGYESSIGGDDCDEFGSVTLAAGESKTCTITNDDIAPPSPPTPEENTLALCSDGLDNDGDGLIDLADPDCAAFIPKLTVVKVVINDDGGTATSSDFTITVTATSPSPASFPGSAAGTMVTLSPGAYSVDEGAVANYSKSFSVDCSGTIAIGETKTCTVTNNDNALVIFDEAVGEPTQTTLTVTWKTNHPATSRVVFDTVSHDPAGAAPNYGYASSTVEDSTLVTSHSVTVTGLTPGTTYFLRAVSHGSPEVTSTQLSGPTSSPPPPTPSPSPSPTPPPPSGGGGGGGGGGGQFDPGKAAPSGGGSVLGLTTPPPATPAPTPAPSPAPQVAGAQTLPRTGMELANLIWLGLVLLSPLGFRFKPKRARGKK